MEGVKIEENIKEERRWMTTWATCRFRQYKRPPSSSPSFLLFFPSFFTTPPPNTPSPNPLLFFLHFLDSLTS
ncbi:unnamed protein product [Meloidogyne enterolobii]|uniref:Uncharacterized protein n=1 Tax=Meloidogyne enterolobii TaxID=390850 RepID=A0ACB0YGF2_MELEN